MQSFSASMGRALVVVAVVGSLIATACGSTAVNSGRLGGEVSGELGEKASGEDLTIADDEGPLGPEVSDGTVASPSPGSPAAAAEAGPRPRPEADTPGSSAPSPGGPIPVGPGARGVTDSTIKLGLLRAPAQGRQATEGALGTRQSGIDDTKAQEAVLEYVNAHGGMAGRKVVPVWYEADQSTWLSRSSRDRDFQRACAAWTEDDPVFAFTGYAAIGDLMLGCADRAQTPMVALRWSSTSLDQKRFESMDQYWYSPHGLIADRRERALVKGLLAQGFFAPGAKVGLLIEGVPEVQRGVERGMKPTLKAAGVNVVAEAVYPDPIESPWSTYVLRFQSAGVTHVLLSATSALSIAGTLVMHASESQGFRPRWGMASDNVPGGLQNSGVAREQLARTQGIGWFPYHEVGRSEPVSASTELCRRLLAEAGQPPSTPNGEVFCEFLFFLKAALDRATVLSPAGLAEAVGGLGTAYESTLTIDGATQFAPGRHDGVSVVRPFAFDDRCGQDEAPCFRYTGPARPVPE